MEDFRRLAQDRDVMICAEVLQCHFPASCYKLCGAKLREIVGAARGGVAFSSWTRCGANNMGAGACD